MDRGVAGQVQAVFPVESAAFLDMFDDRFDIIHN
jgi:hypothetical protein